MSRRHLTQLLLTLLAVWAATAVSQETPPAAAAPDSLVADTLHADSTFIDSLYYTCDSIRYDVPNERMSLAGSASIRYGSANIAAEIINIDMERDQASSSGRVELKDGAYLMLGDALFYDIETREALVDRGATRFDKGFFYGREVRKVGKNTYDIDDGYFTTCDAAEPDYYIWSKRMRLYKDDKLVTRPTVFFVNHFPVMAVPFATISIKRGRQTGILVPEPGYNSYEGKYLRDIAYFYAWRDYADATLAFDYMELTGWEARLAGRYLDRYVLDGNLLARLQKRILSMGRTQYEWLLQSRHHHNIGYASKLDVNLDFVSSREIWEGSVNPDERLSEKVTSRLAYNMPLFSRTIYFSASYNEDLRNDVKTLTLPSVSYALPSKPIAELFLDEDEATDDASEDAWWRDFSFNVGFKSVHTGRVTDPDADWKAIFWQSSRDSTGKYVNEHHAGLRQNMGLSWSRKLWGWFNLGQTVTGNFAVHDRDSDNNKLATGYDWNGTSRTSFSLYGVRSFAGGPLSALRHVLTPSFSFTYKPDFEENDSFYNFGGVGLNSSVRSRSFRFSLDNLWQLKLRLAEGGELKLNDFFKLTSGISYDLEKEGERFSNISHTARLSPGKITTPLVGLTLSDRLTVTQDAYDFDVLYWRLTTTLNFSGAASYTEYFPRAPNRFESSRFLEADTLETAEAPLTIERLEQQAETDGWSCDISYELARHKGKDEPTTHSLRNSLSLRLTRNWYITYTNNYDLLDDRVVSQNLTITRDLHCWKLKFSWTKSGDYWNYSLRLFAVKLPDSLQFRTSDHKH